VFVVCTGEKDEELEAESREEVSVVLVFILCVSAKHVWAETFQSGTIGLETWKPTKVNVPGIVV
jgi:hypothetical protein